MIINSFSRLLDRTGDALRPNLIPWMISLFVLAMCFFVLGALSCLFMASHTFTPSWTAVDKATVYLHPESSTLEQESLARDLTSWPEIRQVSFIPKEEARKRMETLLGQWKGVLEGLGNDFFPPSLEMQFASETLRSGRVPAVITRVRQYPQVEEVLYGKGQSTPVEEKTTAIEYMGWGGIGFMSITALLILFYASRMMVFSCQDALEIYSLTGATDLYNQAPFYLAGMLHGSAGAILAIGFLIFSATEFQAVLPPLLSSAFSWKTSQQVGVSLGLLLCGIFFGWAGSWLALKKSVKF